MMAAMDTRGTRLFCRLSRLGALAFAVVLVFGFQISRAAAAPDFIHTEGTRLVDGRGATFAVKGINLGNWLVPEGYMFKFKQARSPDEITGVIAALVGPQAAARFWTQFRDVYIAKDDIGFIKAAGFNTVRVPLDWRPFVAAGGDGQIESEG